MTTDERFREVLSHLPTGVTAITARLEGEPVGLAVGSFFSVSLSPPLVGWCAAKTSSSWAQVRAAGAFCVNVLAGDQAELCKRFATTGGDKFSGVAWTSAPSGSPRLDRSVVWFDCSIEEVLEAGDHDICIGRVWHLGVERDVEPLVFYRRGYALPAAL